MKVFLAIVLLWVPAFAAEKADVTPVQKVVQLMQGMLAKGQKEKHNEQESSFGMPEVRHESDSPEPPPPRGVTPKFWIQIGSTAAEPFYCDKFRLICTRQS